VGKTETGQRQPAHARDQLPDQGIGAVELGAVVVKKRLELVGRMSEAIEVTLRPRSFPLCEQGVGKTAERGALLPKKGGEGGLDYDDF
jgi:hypothetical protein